MFYDFDNTQPWAGLMNEELFGNAPVAPWVSAPFSNLCNVSKVFRSPVSKAVFQRHHYIPWAIFS